MDHRWYDKIYRSLDLSGQTFSLNIFFSLAVFSFYFSYMINSLLLFGTYFIVKCVPVSVTVIVIFLINCIACAKNYEHTGYLHYYNNSILFISWRNIFHVRISRSNNCIVFQSRENRPAHVLPLVRVYV